MGPDDVVRRLATSGSVAATVDALAAWGDGALFAIDHEASTLTEVGGGASVPLDGPLRVALLGGGPVEVDGTWWTPLLERSQPVFVVRSGHRLEAPSGFTSAVGAMMALARKSQEELERDRRREAMSVAAELQWDVLPPRADAGLGWEIASCLEPAYEVAGDVFDHALCDGALWVYSFDAMGHGVQATLASLLVLAAVRSARRGGADLAAQFDHADGAVWSMFAGDCFVTGIGCRLGADGQVSVVNAGHEPLRRIVGGSVERLTLRSDLPLGIEPGSTRRVHALEPVGLGDSIVLLSDGVGALRAADGTCPTADDIDAEIGRTVADSPLRSVHDVMAGFLGMHDADRVDDDVTVVLVQRDRPERDA